MKNLFRSFETESFSVFQHQSKRKGIKRLLFISIAISNFLISLFVGFNVGIKVATATNEKQTTNDKWAALDSYCANYDVAVSIYPGSFEFSGHLYKYLSFEERKSSGLCNLTYDDYVLIGYLCQNEEAASLLADENTGLIIEVCDSMYSCRSERSFPVYRNKASVDLEYIFVGYTGIYREVKE